MKRLVIFLVCIFLVFGFLQAQDSKPPVGNGSYYVDFSITMRDLSMAAKTQDDGAIPADRAIILDGDIGTLTIYEDTDQAFVVELELLNGTWIGDEQVELYRTYVICEGSRFRPFFSPQSRTRLKSGQTILVLGSYEGLGLDYDEKTPVPVVRALDIRLIY